MASASQLRPTTILQASALQRYFEIALYLLVFTGFGTLVSTGGLSIVTALVVSAALLVRGYLLLARRAWLIPESWTAWLTLGYVAFYLADYFLISGGFLNATVHLVLFVMVVRLFSAQRDRDFYFLSVIAFLMVLSAALLTVDSVFLLSFAVFMLTAVVSFILMEMRHISAKAGVNSRQSGMEMTYRNMATSLAVASPILVLCILLGAAGIFFLLPRASAGYLGAYAPGGEITSGFSDRVELGRIGEIQQSASVVMHIRIDGDDRGSFDLKWRGVALSQLRRPHLVKQPGRAPAVSPAGRSFRIAAACRWAQKLAPPNSLPGGDGAGGNECLLPRRHSGKSGRQLRTPGHRRRRRRCSIWILSIRSTATRRLRTLRKLRPAPAQRRRGLSARCTFQLPRPARAGQSHSRTCQTNHGFGRQQLRPGGGAGDLPSHSLRL